MIVAQESSESFLLLCKYKIVQSLVFQDGIKSHSLKRYFLKMNILNQIVHGTRDAPDLGQVDTMVRCPPTAELERATFGLG